ncbi:MAG: hypothetical protein AMXMBFR57_20130 [Acidimicrobiia bacterium]
MAGETERGAGLQACQSALRTNANPISPFHWEIEFPEVFTRDNGGFDVFVGNPPFAGKNTMAAANREHYPVWLQALHEESHGNADLVAHFYRRAFNLLRKGGTFGLIATNTIAQGDTRGTGLRWIRHHDGTIFAARKRIRWPGEAAVVVSAVHVNKGDLSGPFDLDGRIVERITAFLFHAGGDDDPARLEENANKSFQGSIVLGMGFTFDDTDKKGIASPISLMHELIRKDPRNAERIFPYIGYSEVASSPVHSHHRYVIRFDGLPESECWNRWPDLMSILDAKVKPERLKQKDQDAKEKWWLFLRPRPELHLAIRDLKRVLVAGSQASSHFAFAFLSTTAVFSSNLTVFALDSDAEFAALQSRVHEVWARFFMSTMKDDLAYTPTTCFEPFPFPENWSRLLSLEQAGRKYYEYRAALMVDLGEGLTKIYNRFHDPNESDARIQTLRQLHEAMDHAVLDAYGWSSLRPICEFAPETAADTEQPAHGKVTFLYRWPDEARDEVLARLLELNTTRAGLAPGARAVSQARKPSKTQAASPLFGA